MSNQSTLTSLAMLKVNLDQQNKDYLDYFGPFVAHLLNKYRPEPVSTTSIKAYLKEEFGLEIPHHPIESVLQRFARRKYLKKE